MKLGKMIIAAVALSIVSMFIGGVTCGWLFAWVYKLEPTNVWKPMQGPPSLVFQLGSFILNIVLAAVYACVRNSIQAKNRFAKGLLFGLGVWAIGMVPGMLCTYEFMTVATGVIVYWTVLGLIEMPLKGLIIAAIYGD